MIEERIRFLYNLYWVITGLAFLWFVLLLTPLVNDDLPGVMLIILGVPLWYYMKHIAKQNSIEILPTKKEGFFFLLFLSVMLLDVFDKILWVLLELVKDFFEPRDMIV